MDDLRRLLRKPYVWFVLFLALLAYIRQHPINTWNFGSAAPPLKVHSGLPPVSKTWTLQTNPPPTPLPPGVPNTDSNGPILANKSINGILENGTKAREAVVGLPTEKQIEDRKVE